MNSLDHVATNVLIAVWFYLLVLILMALPTLLRSVPRPQEAKQV
jgi:hypothetical protein